MPQFAILIYTDDSAHAPDATKEDLAVPDGHADAMTKSGAMRAAYAFTPRDMARSVRAGGVSDGPFVDAEQVVAGVYILEARDWDEALALASTDPSIHGANGIEVRLIHSGGVVERP
ncbi:YciI family protein [Microbacterium sp. MAHUQ-60]|uniref:YciI family protein n=1 Tax=unclassified Microbacterium TaxID=2609290 RepID=UPI0036189598